MSLQNFTSIFELLFAYNFAIAFSEKFRNFLGMRDTFTKLIEHHGEFQALQNLVNRQTIYKSIVDENLTVRLEKMFLQLKRKTSNLFYESQLEAYLKPYYIYFGLLSLIYLFLAGTVGDVIDYLHLMFLNTISFLIFVFGLLNSFRIQNEKSKYGSIRLFFGSMLVILFTILLPCHYINMVSFRFNALPIFTYLNIKSTDQACVLFAVFLVFTPILIELFQIIICLVQLKILKRTYDKVVKSVTPILIQEVTSMSLHKDQVTNSATLVD